MHARRKDATEQDDRNKRLVWPDEAGGRLSGDQAKPASNTRAALASVGLQRSELQQKHRHHDLLPSLDSMRSKMLTASEPENVSCSQPPANASAGTTSSTAPSESSTAPPSRRSSSSSRSHVTHTDSLGSMRSHERSHTSPSLGQFGRPGRCPAPPADVMGMSTCNTTYTTEQPMRSQSVGGTSTRSASRAGSTTPGMNTPDHGSRAPSANGSRAPSASGSRTPQPRRMLHMSDISTEFSRASSGSRTPEPCGRSGRQVVPPLTRAELECASQKLKNLNIGDSKLSCRTGWDGDDDAKADDSSLGSDKTLGQLCSIMPVAPSGSRELKNKKGYQRPVAGEKKSGGVGGRFKAFKSSTRGFDDLNSSDMGGSSGSRSLMSGKDSRHQANPRLHLRNGSRDDSFLSTISESTMSTDSTSTDRDSKINGADGSQIEVYSENQATDRRLYIDILKDFHQLFKQVALKDAEQMQQLLRSQSFDKPLEMQRRIIPLIMSAFQDEQKSFIAVQGAPQCGKTSALALGILGAIGTDLPGIRAIVLSTGPVRDFRKCFDICAEVHPIKLICFSDTKRRVSFEGVDPDPDEYTIGMNVTEDMQRLSSDLLSGAPGMIFGHPSRVLPVLREAPAWGIDLGNVQVVALDDAEDSICQGLIDEVCEVCTILRHFSKQRLRHIILSHFLSNEAKSMVRCLRTSLLKQQNLFGIRAHRTQARAKAVNHYYAVAPRARWPAMLAVLHHALSLPSGIIFDDESSDARAHTRQALRALGVTASVWNALQEQRSGARAATRDGAAGTPKGPAFHLMPSDLVVLKVDLPQEQKKASKKSALGGKSLSVLFVEEAEVVRELEKTFHIRMHEVPTEMLPN